MSNKHKISLVYSECQESSVNQTPYVVDAYSERKDKAGEMCFIND